MLRRHPSQSIRSSTSVTVPAHLPPKLRRWASRGPRLQQATIPGLALVDHGDTTLELWVIVLIDRRLLDKGGDRHLLRRQRGPTVTAAVHATGARPGVCCHRCGVRAVDGADAPSLHALPRRPGFATGDVPSCEARPEVPSALSKSNDA